MRLTRVFESLYLKVIIGIVESAQKYTVVVEMIKGKDVKQRIEETFDAGEGMSELVAFVQEYVSESPFHYIALLNTKPDQGAFSSCSPSELELEEDLSTTITVCQKNGWMIYASKPELDQLKKDYKRIGLDFIFSPFSILEHFFTDKIPEPQALYVLVLDESLSFAVFASGRLQYAEQFTLAPDEDEFAALHESVSLSFDMDSEGLTEGIDLDDINAIDDLEGLDDLNDIEDLDAIHELESFEEESMSISSGTEPEPAKFNDVSDDLDTGFNNDFRRFQFIQEGLNRFYTGQKETPDFIETVYIADGCGISRDLKQYLEEELFMKVFIRHVDVAKEVVELAKIEARDAI